MPKEKSKDKQVIKEMEYAINALSFFANLDNITAVFSQTSSSEKNSDLILSLGEIGSSALALTAFAFLIGRYCCHSKKKEQIYLPIFYLCTVIISCLITIAGSALVLSSDNKTDDILHITGTTLIGVSKLAHPTFTSFFKGSMSSIKVYGEDVSNMKENSELVTLDSHSTEDDSQPKNSSKNSLN